MQQHHWVHSATKKWLSLRTVWASVLHNYAHTHVMTQSEFEAFSAIQRWIGEHSEAMMPHLRSVLQERGDAENSLAGTACRFCSQFEAEVDWSVAPTTLLYGSCVQGTAELGGDADFAINFAIKNNNKTTGKSREDADDGHDADDDGGGGAAMLIEPPRSVQRTVVLPALFRQAGTMFNKAVPNFTTKPQQLHVDRIFHARVPILSYVSSQTILPPPPSSSSRAAAAAAAAAAASGDNNSNGIVLTPQEAALPKFDVGAASSGCLNSILLRKYFEELPVLRVLVLALKRWARARAHVIQAKKGWLSPYALTLMAVFWAQQRGLVTPTPETAEWSYPGSVLVDANKCFMPICGGLSVEDCIADDDSQDEAACVGRLLLDFFVFYSVEFDRDTQVVDIRYGKDRVQTREEWKERVAQQVAARNVKIFGFESDGRRSPTDGGGGGGGASKSGSVRHHSSSSLVDGVMRHLFGNDVVCVRDPVEAHSVTRNLDFFRAEAVFEEFRLAAECTDPTRLLALTQ